MKTIIDTLAEYTGKAPNEAILFDDDHSRGITYAQLWDMSGRVYACLKKNGIGRENFVLLNLPRGVMPVIAMIGVWRAGAAWALVEDTYAPERISYIRNDCGCRFELNADNWADVMHTDSAEGYENPDEHDAAYAIYTSGTTGNPKGVLHEYGNLDRAIQSIRIGGEIPFDEHDRLALLAPMNFVASVIVILAALNVFCGKSYIVSYATIKNPLALGRFFLMKRITITFLTPSYVRMLGDKTGPFLRMLFVGSEPANNIYSKKMELINVYACSESGFAVCVFRIDQAYETCPIGKPAVDTRVLLVNEEGEEVDGDGIGELCFENPYVRGYLNLPEETDRAFVDGIYHTGDLARQDPNGDYVLLGRSGDMIKINGNRIEPAEIEAAVKQAMNIEWAAARGFEEDGKSFLCAYYTENITVDSEKLRGEMMKRLPYYMIPAYYMHIDKIPLKPNGKLDREALPKPDISDFRSDYAAPETDIQKALCAAMEKVLKLEKVGIHDDFYEMGGDSLSSIEMITESALPGLTASQIFRGRTPEKIAELYEEALEGGHGTDPDEENREALQKVHPLTREQLYMFNYQLYTPASTMYNLFSVMKLDKEAFEPEKLAEALEKAIRNHPALLTMFDYDKDGNLVQCYRPDMMRPIRVEEMTEFEFRFVKDTLVYPFKLIGGRMSRCRVIETEKAVYVFFDVHHSLFDGTSLKVFMGSIGKAYMGMPLDPDYYYLMLREREEAAESDFYEESRRYFEERYDNIEWSGYPKCDFESRENEMGELITPLEITQAELTEAERSFRISRNELFITIAALSIAVYNRAYDVKLSWIYNCREDLQMMTTVGLLFRDLPVGLRLHDDLTLRDVFADVHDQVQKGIEHSCYPYVDLHNQVASGECAYALYQQDIRDMNGMEGFDVETVDIRQNQAASQTILDMEILDGSDGLQLMIDYAASRYRDTSIEAFRDTYVRVAHTLIDHRGQEDVTIGALRKHLREKKNLLTIMAGVFRRKK